MFPRVNASTGKSRSSAEHLVRNAQNLTQAALKMLKAAEVASVKVSNSTPLERCYKVCFSKNLVVNVDYSRAKVPGMEQQSIFYPCFCLVDIVQVAPAVYIKKEHAGRGANKQTFLHYTCALP